MRNLQLRTFLLLACAPLALAGCIDVFFDPDEPDDIVDPLPTSQARERFIRDVFPILSARCGACHGAGAPPSLAFVGKDPVDGYDRILSFPAIVGDFTPAAPVLSFPVASHPGVDYTSPERSAILAWLDAELAERGGGPPVSPVEAAIQTWSGCLDFGDFTATGMAPAWSALTSNNGPCTTCHVSGTSGVIITPDAQQFFQILTTRRAFLLSYFTVDVTGGIPAAKMIANTTHFQTVGSQQPPYDQHPAFAFASSPAQKALTDLHFATEQRRLAAACAPPRLVD